MMERIAALSPAVICLTEAFEGSTADLGGFEISVNGVSWSKETPLERKVVLWSGMPWTDIDCIGNEDLQSGGFIAATTRTPLGEIRVLGVCVPYHLASPMGLSPRCPAWSQQVLFLAGLRQIIGSTGPRLPTVVLGDYNQFVPRIWGSLEASFALSEALNDLVICTDGQIKGVDRPAIDHIALSADLKPLSIQGIDEYDANGRKLGDHFGVAVRVGLDTASVSVRP
ncbi:endonuclease/exonuclease/phosphatase family protein [Mesorhizobium sp. CO1-1-8]|uniref:endonuclease/exonuclease/phosphatase family protein n=1 Tax=Mesorhizobium sp. CO1-1-8 TaxID=2876631 RepID=UPI001CD18972|nr:endonuclease/exonuclease/phosphatase family protein [Mesorhizobium sp. CO1-1-8]MBZ9774067.1 endonuclease/exonuclease/phosphatase family protein [Mesorhizobium sp. CO1-1-8]